ncbi:hypothetical protein [Thiocapsa bogorovii]|uniref:hypothetical protein n=1 Tax=Thiocapsa bogorovii TaxID=521689 RepID=UPI001E3C786F|nr:hypothetical protein [Thiocapsa bogorovii]UHD17117.1 hypothetical protein LT988_03405 [Thiocapsa bogorovii]
MKSLNRVAIGASIALLCVTGALSAGPLDLHQPSALMLASLDAPTELRFLKEGEGPPNRPEEGVKWYPGHYVFIGNRSKYFMDDEPDQLVRTYNDYAPYQIIRGSQVRYVWRELEPTTKGSYRFDKILADADYLHARGKKLIIQLQHKTFVPGQKVVPPYMETAEYDGGHFQIGGSNSGGWMMNSWHPKVQERYTALITALAAAVDAHPAIALININESAVSPPPDMLDWSQKQAATRDYVASLGPYLRSVFKETPTLSYANSPESWLPAFENSARQSGNGHGGPDTIPTAWEYGQTVTGTYDMAIRLRGLVPLMYSIQTRNYLGWEKGPTAGEPVPIEDLFGLHKDTLKTNFATWTPRDPYWANVKALWSKLPQRFPNDPAGGLQSKCPTLIAPCR